MWLVFQFNLTQFLSTWEKSVPEGMKTSLYQLEVRVVNVYNNGVECGKKCISVVGPKWHYYGYKNIYHMFATISDVRISNLHMW